MQAGVDADNILAAAHTLSRADKVELQDRTLLLLTNQMDRFLASRSVGARGCQCNVRSLTSVATCTQLFHRRSITPAFVAACNAVALFSYLINSRAVWPGFKCSSEVPPFLNISPFFLF